MKLFIRRYRAPCILWKIHVRLGKTSLLIQEIEEPAVEDPMDDTDLYGDLADVENEEEMAVDEPIATWLHTWLRYRIILKYFWALFHICRAQTSIDSDFHK